MPPLPPPPAGGPTQLDAVPLAHVAPSLEALALMGCGLRGLAAASVTGLLHLRALDLRGNAELGSSPDALPDAVRGGW